MTVQSAQSVTVLFTTRIFATGVGTNADSLPTGTLYLNGTANGATVTVTNISAGLYKAQVTLPTLAVADEVEIAIAATVSTISDTAVIWGDTKDILVDGSGDVTFNNTSIATVTTVTNQLTAAAIATGVWQDSTAGDFTTASSIGKSLYTSGVVPGGANGLFIAGTNAATTVNFTGSLSGSVGSVTARVTANTDQWTGGTIPAPNVTGVPLVDDKYLLGTIYTTPATAGIMDINVKNMNNVSATSITAINANQGTTQPINFTGTGASALAKSDMVDISGVAVSTSTAQIGVNVVSVAGAASNIKKNQALANFMFLMTDSTTHAPKTGLTVAGTVAIDGGSFGSLTNAVSEVANGWYKINLAAADLNGNNIALRFTATNADDRDIGLITQP